MHVAKSSGPRVPLFSSVFGVELELGLSLLGLSNNQQTRLATVGRQPRPLHLTSIPTTTTVHTV